MSRKLHFCPLENAMSDFSDDFRFIRDLVFAVMLDYDHDRRDYAESTLKAYYGDVIVGAENVNGSIFLDVTNGDEVRSVYLAEIPDTYRYSSNRVRPFRLIE